MNVTEVIAELQKLPGHLPVRAFNSLIIDSDEGGGFEVHPTEIDAQEVTAIHWRGYDVCLDCDGMCAPL